MNINTTIPQGDFQRLQVGFWLRDPLGSIDAENLVNLPAFELNHYMVETRQTKRHQWKVKSDQVWTRLNQRNNTLKREEIVIPQEALDKLRAVMNAFPVI